MTIEEVKRRVIPIFKQYGVTYAAVFGSLARGEADQQSDVDILVRVGPLPFGIWGFVGLKQELEAALGMKVDVVSEAAISPLLARKIKKDLTPIYALS